MPVDAQATQLRALLLGHARYPREIQQLLGISQPTFSRLITGLGNQVAALGKGRAIRYGLPRDVRGLGSTFPVFQVDSRGDVRPLGILQALHGGEYWWGPAHAPGELFIGLPWFLQDMRPDGFVGRAFAQQQASDLGLPPRLSEWTDDDLLVALSRRGDDSIGNLIIGHEALSRYLLTARSGSPSCPPAANCLPVYIDMAQQAMTGGVPGSSAGGEQPKFTAQIQDRNDVRHVLVKFSPSTETEEGRRWADLLICEHLALETICRVGMEAARSRILQSDTRVFLEVNRFDRTGTLGRLPVLSLGAVDDGFFGRRDNWAAAADRLQDAKMIAPEAADCMRWLYLFGGFIANTDQHFGNISLLMQGPKTFVLAPIYDMLPMLYRPAASELPPRAFSPPAPSLTTSRAWDTALQAALEFWRTAAEDLRISPEFRKICRENYGILQVASAGPRLIL